MSKTRYLRFGVAPVVIGLIAFLAVPGPAGAQVLGTGGLTVTLAPLVVGGTSISTGTSAMALTASTGPLANSWDAIDASLDSGTIPIGTATMLEATAIGEGDLVTSAASLGDLVLTTPVGTVSASFAMATATADSYGGLAGWSEVDDLVVNGVTIAATGALNQTIVIGTLQVVLNEEISGTNGITVNALHVTTLDGLVNVTVGSATAVRP